MDYYSYYDANDYLAHYGVLGMKWGVRNAHVYARTQNKLGGHYTYREKEKMQRTAAKIEKQNLRQNQRIANTANRSLNRMTNKYNKLQSDYNYKKAAGSPRQIAKANAKAESQYNKINTHGADLLKLSQTYGEKAMRNTQTIKSLSDGTLKAGRDYVTNTTVSSNLVLDVLGLINVGIDSDVTYRTSAHKKRR